MLGETFVLYTSKYSLINQTMMELIDSNITIESQRWSFHLWVWEGRSQTNLTRSRFQRIDHCQQRRGIQILGGRPLERGVGKRIQRISPIRMWKGKCGEESDGRGGARGLMVGTLVRDMGGPVRILGPAVHWIPFDLTPNWGDFSFLPSFSVSWGSETPFSFGMMACPQFRSWFDALRICIPSWIGFFIIIFQLQFLHY